MTEAALYHWLILSMLLLAGAAFISLFFVAAPYGRHTRTGWGPSVNDRLGWVVMESAAPAVFLVFFLVGPDNQSVVSLAFLGMWEIHYVHLRLSSRFRCATKMAAWRLWSLAWGSFSIH